VAHSPLGLQVSNRQRWKCSTPMMGNMPATQRRWSEPICTPCSESLSALADRHQQGSPGGCQGQNQNADQHMVAADQHNADQ